MQFSSGITPEDIKVFLDEAEEQLQLLEDDLVRLEREESPDELLQEIFRAAHTLKGSSATLGHQRMAELTHAMENAFDQLRKGNLQVSSHLIDTLFEAHDALGVMTEDIRSGSDSNVDISAIVEAIKDAIEEGIEASPTAGTVSPQSQPGSSSPQSQPGSSRVAASPALPIGRGTAGAASVGPGRAGTAPTGTGASEAASTGGIGQEAGSSRVAAAGAERSRQSDPSGETGILGGGGIAAPATGKSAVYLEVRIAQGCPMPSVRAFQVVDLLSSMGEIISSVPSLDDVEAGNVDYDLMVALSTDRAVGDIEAAVKDISDLQTVTVRSVAESELPGLTTAISQNTGHATGQGPSGELSQTSGQASGQMLDRAPNPMLGQTPDQASGWVPGEASGEAPVQRSVQGPDRTTGQGANLASEQGSGRAQGSSRGGGQSAANASLSSTNSHPTSGQSSVAGAKGRLSATVRVDTSKLDTLMNLVAELVIDRARLAQLEKELEARYRRDEMTEELNRTSLHVGRVTAELQDEIMKIRMLPIENVFRKFPRMVRDTAQKLGKEINFVMEGQDTELDRSVIEEISDPLIHLLRNAVGHGIEYPEDRLKAGKPRQGLVRLSAYHQENNIVICVEDDGKGIDVAAVKRKAVERGMISEDAASRLSDREAMNLIFAPGLSTAAKVDDISGRGVGMDIVRSNIEKLNGSISIESQKGKGTKFIVHLPLTLAIIKAQLVVVGGKVYAMPISSVERNLREAPSVIKTVKGSETYVYRGKVLPVLRLRRIFGAHADAGDQGGDERIFIVVVKAGDEKVGLVVDRLMGQQEIVIKNLSGVVGDIKGLSGVTILGDGRLALIIDVPSLVRQASLKQLAV